MYNKESILKQIDLVFSNMKRLQILVETDLAPLDINVCLYCCEKGILQLTNIQEEMNPQKRIKQ